MTNMNISFLPDDVFKPTINKKQLSVKEFGENYFKVYDDTYEYILPLQLSQFQLIINYIINNEHIDDRLYKFIYDNKIFFSPKYDKTLNKKIYDIVKKKYSNWVIKKEKTWFKKHEQSFLSNMYKQKDLKININGKTHIHKIFVKPFFIKTPVKNVNECIRKSTVSTLNKYVNIKHAMNIEKILYIKTKNLFEDYKDLLYHTLDDLRRNHSVQMVIKTLVTNNIKWKRPCFNAVRELYEEQYEFILNPFEVVDGLTQCNKCKCTKIIMFSKQTRSGDETATTLCICSNRKCNSRWSYSG